VAELGDMDGAAGSLVREKITVGWAVVFRPPPLRQGSWTAGARPGRGSGWAGGRRMVLP
jgi:hypothetical protein